jgi:hypothetical protein
LNKNTGVQEFRSSGVQEFRSSGVQEFRSSGVQEFRSSGVQEFRRILNQRTCLEIGATFLGVRVTIPHSQEFQWLP